MDTSKEKILNETYQRLMEVVLNNKRPISGIEKVVISDVMGFGTTIDEKIFSLNGFKDLVNTQRKQSKGLDMNWEITPVMRRLTSNTNTAVFADDLALTIKENEEIVKMYLRFSTIFEYINSSWKLVHWHASKPENTQSETDTFGIDKWKQKNTELKKLVKERTAELSEKNRELQMESALERVRARTMAMQHSDELEEASQLLDSQVRSLGIETWGCAFHIYNEENASEEMVWDMEWFSSQQGILTPYKTPREHIFKKYYEISKTGIPLHIENIEHEQIKEHYEYLQSIPGIGPDLKKAFDSGVPLPESQIDHVAFFDQGHLLFITYESVPEAHEIFIRFAQVFQQTYTRFLDLQKAEAQARESQIETAVERVRATALAMDKSEDILQVVLKLKEEVMNLHIPNVAAATIFMQTKDGRHRMWDISSIKEKEGSLHLPLDITFKLEETHKDLYLRRLWAGKEKYFLVKQDYRDLLRTFQWLRDNGKIKQAEEAEEFVNSTKFKHLYHPTVQLTNGRMCIDLLEPPTAEMESILLKTGAAFDFAYKRFEDLQLKEEQALKLFQDKKQLEKTLSDLKSAQSQLVQSEKMASLGELTAGIAHEIQNPLNFVNNFSEVSKELLVEMQEELKQGNLEDVQEIMADIIQNLEKINHHGQRADGIVKGMLQHSRINSGQKEEITVNGFVDEYLRLAYHGLRAKDKSFNAGVETNFDPKAGKILAVPQDLGRVVLNLVTNAFYACTERSRNVVNEKKTRLQAQAKFIQVKDDNSYEPTVWVSTSYSLSSEEKGRGEVIISVRDNGTGIPEEIKDKIFQPFFTTKPTGQGTGLGLSLSYDIIKSHGGELNVESEEGVGATFKIILPKY